MRSFDPTEFHRLPVLIIVVPIKENLIKTRKSYGTCVFLYSKPQAPRTNF